MREFLNILNESYNEKFDVACPECGNQTTLDDDANMCCECGWSDAINEDNAEYDYGYNDEKRPRRYQMDVHDYKGKAEHNGPKTKIVNNYGDNPMVMAEDDIDEDDEYGFQNWADDENFERHEDYEDEDDYDFEPEVDDGYIVDRPRGGYDASCDSKFLGNFTEYDDAMAAIKKYCGSSYHPNIWFVDDHGGHQIVTENKKSKISLEEQLWNEYCADNKMTQRLNENEESCDCGPECDCDDCKEKHED